MSAAIFAIRDGVLISTSIEAAFFDRVILSASDRSRSTASSSNAASIASWSMWISDSRGSKCSGSVAPSRIESWNEYRDR